MPGRPRFCSWQCKSESQRRQKPVTKEWLEQKYLVEGLGAPDIAKLVNRDSKRVWEWLRDFGIPTRPRGMNEGPHFKKGHKLGVGRVVSEEVKAKLREERKRTPNLPHLVGGTHWLKGKLPEEHPNWKGGTTPQRQQLYSTPEWKAVAKQVWRRERGVCQRCGVSRKQAGKDVNLDIHHIVGFQVEALRCVLSNLALLCEPCHYWVHSRKNKEKEFLG